MRTRFRSHELPADPSVAARRAGRARAIVAVGPMAALLAGLLLPVAPVAAIYGVAALLLAAASVALRRRAR